MPPQDSETARWFAEEVQPHEPTLRGYLHGSDPGRPFRVSAGDVDVEAVGTAFNVRFGSSGVDVLVTKGKVQIAAGFEARSDAANRAPLVAAGQRATIAITARSEQRQVVISDTSAAEVARTLGWREPLLTLGGATLAELLDAFEQQTGRRVILENAELRRLRVGGSFPGDDFEGFVRLLTEYYGFTARSNDEGNLVLGKSP